MMLSRQSLKRYGVSSEEGVAWKPQNNSGSSTLYVFEVVCMSVRESHSGKKERKEEK